MLRRGSLLLLCAALVLVGCVGNGLPPIPVPPPPPVKKSGVIRVGFPTSPDAADVPSLMAHELLKAQGYSIERTDFDNPELVVAALAEGRIDISNGSTRTHWAAAQKGADIVTIMQEAANEWSFVARADITACADLNGKKLGVQSAGSISNALLQAYLSQNCPEAKPQVLYVAGSENRIVALQAGELDGTLIEIAEGLQLEKAAAGKFPVLFSFARALPQLKTTGIYTSRAFGTKKPEIVRDYLRAVLTVYRSVRENPQPLYDALQKQLKWDAATAKEIGDAYLAHNIWNVDGDLSQDDVKYSLDLFVKTGSIPPGLDPAKITDTSYLDAVLNEMGRK